jgi:hypothetical protein
MDFWQFSLFFVALVVGYVLMHLRLVRFEEHLQKLAGIRSLDDRLRQLDDRLAKLGESFDRVRLDRVEGQLERLHHDLEDLREATSDVRHAVVQIPAPPAAVPAPVEAPTADRAVETPATRIVGLVESRLLQLGYHDVVLLSELASVDFARDVELQVECWQGGMPVKGRVLVRNGSVRDVALQSAAPMFP